MLVALDNKNNRVHIIDSIESEKYYCQYCGEELCRKLGKIKMHHFSHKPYSNCTDSEWHDMSPWHVNWQNQFPTKYQEILKIDSSGKKHIADVLIDEKTVIEFQHSNLPYEIFNDRNEFYHRYGYKVIWVFDGNEIINDGNLDYKINYINPLKLLSKQGTIPDYLNIFIEGTIEHNLFDREDGKFLFHVSNLSNKGIELNGKIKINEFIDKVNKNEEFSFGLIENEKKQVEVKKQSLIEIIKEHPNADNLIVYNTKTGYDVLINRYNMNRALEYKFFLGKMKKHKLFGDFQNKENGEIFYSKEEVWIFQAEYKND